MKNLTALTEQNIQARVGRSIQDIRADAATQTDRHIEKKIGKQLEVTSPRKHKLIGRGSPMLGRLSQTIDIDKRIAKI